MKSLLNKIRGKKQAEPHFLFGKPAINPSAERNVKRLKKRHAKFVWISKAPVYKYNEIGLPEFSGMTAGQTYVRTEPKEETPKRIRARWKKLRSLLSMLFLLFSFAAQAQDVLTLNIGGKDPAKAQLCYNSQTGLTEILLPGLALSVIGEATHEVNYPKALNVEQGCVIAVDELDGEPMFWAYWLGRAAEIHVPVLGATYVTGLESDLYLAPRPTCALMLAQQHKHAVEQQRKYNPTVTD